MGNYSVVLIAHDGLDQIKDDPKFGENVYNAILDSRCREDGSVFLSAGNHCNPAEVIGHYFHGDETKIYVFEGGTGWVAGVGGKPNWSSLTWEMITSSFKDVNKDVKKVLKPKK